MRRVRDEVLCEVIGLRKSWQLQCVRAAHRAPDALPHHPQAPDPHVVCLLQVGGHIEGSGCVGCAVTGGLRGEGARRRQEACQGQVTPV